MVASPAMLAGVRRLALPAVVLAGALAGAFAVVALRSGDARGPFPGSAPPELVARADSPSPSARLRGHPPPPPPTDPWWEGRAWGSPRVPSRDRAPTTGTRTYIAPATWTPIVHASVHIEVVDEEGAPVPRTNVSFRGFGRRTHGVTDARGVVTLEVDTTRKGTLRVWPPNETGLLMTLDETWQPGDAQIVLRRAYAIGGRVVDEHGAPVARAVVQRRTREGVRQETTDAEGRFLLPFLEAGVHELRALPPDSAAAELPWRAVHAGREDVVLAVHRGVSLTVQILDWPEGVVGALEATAAGGEARSHRVYVRRGTAVVTGLLAGERYTVWGPVGSRFGSGSRGYVYADGVRSDGGPLTLRLEKGLRIDGRVALPSGAKKPAVEVRGRGFSRRAIVRESGAFSALGLPPGTWTVRAEALGPDGARLVGTRDVPAGTRGLEIAVAP